MSQIQNFDLQEENELKKISELFLRNYKLIIVSIVIAVGLAFLINRYSIPAYRISSSILIKENASHQNARDVNDFLNSSLLGKNQNFQNELWVIKSSPVIDQTIKNLDLYVTYYHKEKFRHVDAYQNVPFRILLLADHPQPVNISFKFTLLNEERFQLEARSSNAVFYNYETDQISHKKDDWFFIRNGTFGEMIETEDLAFVIEKDNSSAASARDYGFGFRTIASLNNEIKGSLEFKLVDRLATVIEIRLKSESLDKGIDIVNEMMKVYSEQNLTRKNHIAHITIDYIEKQLNEISDSLSQTEDNLQRFRSTNQLLNITDQATGMSAQYLDLQNRLAELVSRKRYYDYVSEYLKKNDNFSNIMLPAALGIPDQILNNLITDLITAQSQRSNLIQNNQERNPLVQKLAIQTENIKKTISENISAVGKTTSLSIDEMNKRISKIEAEISRLPMTQRKLGNIERKYRLNDAIYNYLLEKRAEAKITQASNLPDDIIIEPAGMVGIGPVSPNKKVNYVIALFMGFIFPFGFLTIKSVLNNKIESQEDIEMLSKEPVLGKIFHSQNKSRNVMYEFPKSNIAESFRALRTNLDFYIREGQKKVIMVSSCLQGEGKTFIALNLAMSYAQLGRRTILVNFDLRKPETFFKDKSFSQTGLSSYLINKSTLEEIILKSPHEKLDYILSGMLPPNPVELIALEKTSALMAKLREDYDVIVLDTNPLAQVTDAFLLIEHSDLKIVVARLNFSLKKVFSQVIRDLQHKKVKNICVVLNDNKVYSDQYGYGYGYYNKDIKDKKSRKVKSGLEKSVHADVANTPWN